MKNFSGNMTIPRKSKDQKLFIMDKICKDCKFCKGSWCNRLVIPGGFGRHDRVASDYLKDNKCKYYEKGKVVVDYNKPNFENS